MLFGWVIAHLKSKYALSNPDWAEPDREDRGTGWSHVVNWERGRIKVATYATLIRSLDIVDIHGTDRALAIAANLGNAIAGPIEDFALWSLFAFLPRTESAAFLEEAAAEHGVTLDDLAMRSKARKDGPNEPPPDPVMDAYQGLASRVGQPVTGGADRRNEMNAIAATIRSQITKSLIERIEVDFLHGEIRAWWTDRMIALLEGAGVGRERTALWEIDLRGAVLRLVDQGARSPGR